MYDYGYGSVPSVEEQEQSWKRGNRGIFQQGNWKQIQGRELTSSDIGKRVKFLWFIAWENDSTDVDGIIKAVYPYPNEDYYFVAEIVGGTESRPIYHNYNVYGQTMYVLQN